MSVPAILGTSFMGIATKNIATQEQHVELLNGTKVPIRRDGSCTGHPVASVSAVCACPQVVTAKLRPARKTWVQPGTVAHIPVKSTYLGHGFVTGRTPLYHNHGVQVARGPAIMVAGEPLTVPVMHLGPTPLRRTTDMTVGYIDAYDVGSRAHRISAASHCTSAAFLRPSHFRKLRTTGLQMSSYVSTDAWILCKAMSSF